ncbi:sterol delta-7 reductase DWF5 [Coccomyxa subellipsoidea C-169]|uniref:7-dehydrocholesterol reductase n=1 Tax=Coccomyxa subellipsoidea (strain C-169) TaxID=574566 RepID=I0Z580_COCSC|nr:sterol delta-7 reductase DWF5 [Coccomyxa subellipsoidea C-169]EIE25799.1 sterol delta-7 reductase DWF5 [Coccomyxa subellipsoidea C-169]|eukprot:XP_005650343.1 sterol delta-7 reductase DWF5 [Coccomyxa subellipsoidea C-169]
MVTTRAAARAQTPLGKAPPSDLSHSEPSVSTQNGKKTWAETAGAGEHIGAWGIGGTAGHVLAYLGTLALMIGCPAFAIYMWFTLTHLDGSLVELVQFAQKAGFQGVRASWPWPSQEAWAIIASFGGLQAFLQLALPGAVHKGPVSPKGNVPVYKANGVLAYFTTLALFVLGWQFKLFSPARVYDLFGEILSGLNMFSLLFCLFLYFKGKYAPSSSDSGSTGSLMYDYYWGMELYPRIGRHFDLKTWTNCRMGMMGWGVLVLCYAVKQHELYGYLSNSMAVSILLMHLYIFKFFLWETGYWGTMDIAHDRAGYYLCWGCLNWVPAIYTSPALYLVENPIQWSLPAATAIAVAGTLAIYINYDSDRQRQVFRATNGKALVWGKPPQIISAKYITGDGKQKTSLLLASGWWGLARHFHYLPEILAAFFWTLPAGISHALPYFYVFFLTLLLTDRAFRDDVRCSSKYGAYWQQYTKAVPYKMIPYIF